MIGSHCKSSRDLNKDNWVYAPEDSTSYQGTSLGCSVQFGSGSLLGYFGKDDLRLGGSGEEPD